MSLLSPNALLTAVKTPCIGVCSTGIGDNVCRGCKRFSAEVIHWNGLAREERIAIYERLESLLLPIVENYFVIHDADRLRAQMARHQINDAPYFGNGLRVLHVLQAGSTQITDSAEFGLLTIRSDLDLPAIKMQIDEAFYRISVAHYERYFLEPLMRP